LPQTVFFAITIISAGLIILPTWNYTRFYTALNNFDYTLVGATLNASNLNLPTTASASISLTLLVTNPTDYSGLQIGSYGCDLQYVGPIHMVTVIVPFSGGHTLTYNTSLWDLTSTASTQLSGPIGPYSSKTLTIKANIKPDYSSGTPQETAVDFLNYLATTSSKQIQWYLDCHIGLVTFLGTFDEEKTFYPTTSLNLLTG